MKHLGIHSESKKIKSTKHYAMYAEIAEKFDDSITKTQKRLKFLSESKSRKILKASLLIFGMAFSAADEVFLTIGFGVLLLSGPWGWVVLGVTALIGAILFYAAFHNMIRDKVTPTLKQKEEVIEKYKDYKKDNLLEGIKKRLEVKKYIETLEARSNEKDNKIHQLELKEKMLNEKIKELEKFQKSLQKFSHFKPVEKSVGAKELPFIKISA